MVALSRRKPRDLYGARHVAGRPDRSGTMHACRGMRCRAQPISSMPRSMRRRTWSTAGAIQTRSDTNDLMLRNLMAALEPVAPKLRHVALLQGTKAYGVHVRPLTVPAREGRSEMYEQPNFYWAQENFLRELQQGKGVALEHFAPGADRRRSDGRRDGSDPAARRLCGDAARAGPRAGLSRRRGAGVAGGRRRSAGARHRLVRAKPTQRATRPSTLPMATSSPGRMSGRRLRMRST